MPKPFATRALICLALTAITLALYWPVRHHDFINYDDPDYVSANPVVQQGLTWAGLKWAFTTTHSYNWHPLTWLSHMLDVQLFGMHPGAHHLTSVALHIVSTLLLFWLLQRTTSATWRSAVVAGIFAWHPLHIESVAWACERKDVLSTCFWMLTLHLYVRFTENKLRRSAAKASRFYYATLGCFALGLMAKPMLVTIPFVLLLLDAWPLRRISAPAKGRDAAVQKLQFANVRPLLLEKLPFFGLTVASCIVTFLVQQREGAVVQLQHFPLPDRIANALISYVRYIGKTLWPTDLVIFYEPPAGWALWMVLGAAFLLVVLTAFSVRKFKQHPALAVGWLWFLGTLVPVIGLVQVGMQSIADRYMYVPMIGLLVALVWGIADLLARIARPTNGWAVLASVPALIGCVVLTKGQLPHWRNSESVFRHVLGVNPNTVMAHVMLANALIQQQRFDEAVGHFQKALRRQPDFAEVHFNLANVFVAQQNIPAAITEYQTALRLKPGYADAHANLAVALGMAGKLEQAIEHYQLALRVTPGEPDVLRNLSIDLTTLRRFEEATDHLQHALRVNPHDALAHMLLGDVVAAQGNWTDAAVHYARALDFNPDLTEARQKLVAARQQPANPRSVAP